MTMRPSAQTIISTAASLAASVVLVRTIANDLLPHHIQDLLFSSLRGIFDRFSSDLTIVIDEFNGFSANKVYAAAQMYLGSKISPSKTRWLRVSKDDSDKDLTLSMERGQTIVDVFQDMKLEWQFIRHENEKPRHSHDDFGSSIVYQSHSFNLTFHQKHKDKVLQSYLPHVLAQAKAMMDEKKTLKLHAIDHEAMRFYGSRTPNPWKSVNLNHPATFSTVAMDVEAKEALMEDLQRFVKRKEFYRRVGKAWKRGYLLYGPPGTGKSSLISAMANFLNFDVYDLELTDLSRNSDLRKLLIATANRSILVIEDIDCTVDFKDRNEAAEQGAMVPMGRRRYEDNKMTLSGLLNFIDGLWSSCGDERIIVFTTNHKEKLDPALLRPGRMDVHIHMSYCTFFGFKTLANNYLAVEDHPSFQEIKQLMMEAKVTPAQVAEELMKSDDPGAVFGGFIEFLKRKKLEDEEEEAKSNEEVEHEEKPVVENA